MKQNEKEKKKCDKEWEWLGVCLRFFLSAKSES